MKPLIISLNIFALSISSFGLITAIRLNQPTFFVLHSIFLVFSAYLLKSTLERVS